jgi:fused signal recognition particle receptor
MALFNIFNKKQQEEVAESQADTRKGMEKTRAGFFERLGKALLGKSEVDASFLDSLEEILLTSDVGVDTTVEIIKRLEKRVSRDKYTDKENLLAMLREEIGLLMPDIQMPVAKDFLLNGSSTPYVVLVVGVNGVGKTTTIGKLAAGYAKEGKKVILGAADTFRAAAVDQLTIWKDRTGAEIVSHGMNADPASVAFDTVKKAVEVGADVVIIDTAGRLHNKIGLMNELAKIKRVIEKFKPDAPHEVLLVIDATTGQNAFEQAREFTLATKVNTMAVTKLDGTARGGVVIGVSHAFNIPVKYIGIGEQQGDLRLFNKEEFIQSVFQE